MFLCWCVHVILWSAGWLIGSGICSAWTKSRIQHRGLRCIWIIIIIYLFISLCFSLFFSFESQLVFCIAFLLKIPFIQLYSNLSEKHRNRCIQSKLYMKYCWDYYHNIHFFITFYLMLQISIGFFALHSYWKYLSFWVFILLLAPLFVAQNPKYLYL